MNMLAQPTYIVKSITKLCHSPVNNVIDAISDGPVVLISSFYNAYSAIV